MVLVLSIPCALGFNLLSGFVPFASGSGVPDPEDFLVSNCCLPIGALINVLFCVSKKGWGFENFIEKANVGKGLKMPRWLKPYRTYALPLIIISIFIMGILQFRFADNFAILGWIQSLV